MNKYFENWYSYPKHVRRSQIIFLLNPVNFWSYLRTWNKYGIRGFKGRFYSPFVQYDILKTGLYGHMFSADIHVSAMTNPPVKFIVKPK